MPELKRNFAQGKMNKDLDERLVPPGEYRDANNIQVSTSDGSDVGAVQTMLGNTRFIESAKLPAGCKCVGAIADGKNDNLYWLVRGPSKFSSEAKKYDFILQVNVEYGQVKYVVVDNWQTVLTTSVATSSAATLTFSDAAGVRAGMYAVFNDSSSQPQRWEVLSVISNVVTLAPLNGVAISLSIDVSTTVYFEAPKVLNFSGDIITAINIVDDNLFWTDNESEPKKINITRCKLGTGKATNVPDTNVVGDIPTPGALQNAPFNGHNYNIHTRLVSTLNDGTGPEVITNAAGTKAVFLQEEHITVIRKNPVTPLYLEMSSTDTDRYNQNGIPNNIVTTISSTRFVDSTTGVPHDTGFIKINVFFTTAVDYRIGDILIMKSADNQSSFSDFSDYEVRAQVSAVPSQHQPPNTIMPGVTGNAYEIIILSIVDSAANADESWSVTLEQKKPLFEFKFCRFSYRYKYVDGEYSCYAPWSEVAFLPNNFDYLPKQAYNLGMTNNLRSLTLKNYIVEDSLRPRDVVEVDILYKESNSPLVYTVKTIKHSDGFLVWPNTSLDPYERGTFEIDSEMIHAVVPSNQLLRPWDNVPRYAKSQEITGNRLVYGNYKQNYNLTNSNKEIRPNLSVSLISGDNTSGLGEKSIKTMRNYQLGIVYGDEYGRETPVLTDQTTGAIKVDIEDSTKTNKLQVKINSTSPDWAKTWKFYIKETSNEYYNLAMDRWYDAQDDCVWLSFPSAERNKIDEETFLILKKQHDSDVALEEEARYKCIAIENDAPDFIKKKKTSLGVISNGAYGGIVDNIIGDSSSGFPFVNQNFFTILQTNANNTWGSDVWDKYDNLEIRFTSSSGGQSVWYEVASVAPIGNNEVLFTLKTKFGDDMLFTTTDDPQTWANRILTSNSTTLQVELAYVVVDNKPEFDGRFFVKINKDLLLKDNLLGITNPDDLIVTSASKVQYINTTQGSERLTDDGINGVVLGRFQDATCDYNNDPTIAHDANALIAVGQLVTGTGIPAGATVASITDSTHFELSASTTGGSKTNQTLTFTEAGIPTKAVGQDANGLRLWTNGRTTYIWNPTYVKDPPDGFEKTNNHAQGSRQEAREFWKAFSATHKNHDRGNWFIDQAAVRSDNDSGSPAKFMGMRGAGHNVPFENDIDAGFGTAEGGAIFNHPTAGALNLYLGKTQDPDSTAFKDSDDHVLNGKGIHAKNYAIDISFAGIWPYGADIGKDGVVNRIQDAVSSMPQYEQDVDFATKLFTIGSRFRFKTDPDSVVYTVLYVRELWGLRNYDPEEGGLGNGNDDGSDKSPNHAYNKRQRWTVVVDKQFGKGASQFWPLDIKHDGAAGQVIEVLEAYNEEGGYSSENPAIWETEPKEDVGLDIYYEASQAFPMDIDFRTNEQFIPVGSIVTHFVSGEWVSIYYDGSAADTTVAVKTYSASDQKVTLDGAAVALSVGTKIRFEHPDGGAVHAIVETAVSAGDTAIILHGDGENTDQQLRPHSQEIILPWSNCYSFGNGVESDRIRDDYNQVTITNGVKASTVLAEQYKEEHRSSGLIFSGIYNTNSGVNRLNQFIQAEKITKDLNPSYGSIQKLYQRDTDLITFCEDKVLRIVANKDALFNADGNPQLIATDRVLGQAVPYVGDFGISTNPESFAAENFRVYFTDRQRGAVLRLSRDGLTPISEKGMRDWFKDNFGFVHVQNAIGAYDRDKNAYNLTIKSITNRGGDEETEANYTLSFKESIKGWQSFHSYTPEFGVSCNNKYFTFKDGFPYQHHTNVISNNYYGTQYYSDITMIFNDMPGAVKSFNTINYEGTQSRILQDLTDDNYYNLATKKGWYVDTFTTDQQTGTISEFLNKEGKWFNYLKGDTTSLSNLDGLEFSVQGIGNPSSVTHSGNSDGSGGSYKLYVNDSSDGTDGTGWDDGNTYT